MKLLLLFVGKTSDAYLKDGIEIFLNRISKYVTVSTLIISPSAIKDTKKAMEEEGKGIQSKLLPGDFLVVLDEKGLQIGSRQFAGLFSKWMVQGIGRIVFVTGGAFGISPTVKKRANYTLSLSAFTFTHQMVRLILAEQIYRAMTITRNEGYHHD